MVFVDFQKVFDTISHKFLWRALSNQGIDDKIIDTLKYFYDNAKAYIKLDESGPKFALHRGVKQGDPLSPNLFNALLEEVFRDINWEGCGIRVDGCYLNHLRFVDDIVLISGNLTELQGMLDQLAAASLRAGLEINVSKTKYLGNDTKGKIYLNGKELISQENFTYLGQTISFGNKMKKELEARRDGAWRGYWALGSIFKGKMDIRLKVRILESCIFPILLYGAQTWTLTIFEAKKLMTTQK